MFESHIRDEMASHGLYPPSIVIDGKFHRFSTKQKKSDTAGWYVFHERDGLCFGAFGDHRAALMVSYSSKKESQLSATERLDYRQKQDEIRRQIARDKKQAAAAAAKKAASIYDAMQPVTSHPYLERKGIKAHAGIGQRFGALVIPMYLDGEICNVQFIGADGAKRFLKGSIKQAAYHVIGNIDAGDVLVCEGYATAATLHEATSKPAVVAFDAGNLVDVGKAIKKKHPESNLIYCADSDENGVGFTKAEAARKATGGGLRVLPDGFTGGSDFNDYAAAYGLQAVADIIYAPPSFEPEYDFPDYEHSYDCDEYIPFKILGRHAGRCYYIPADGFIYDYSPASHGKQVLLALAPLGFWLEKFPSHDGCIHTDAAVSWLLEMSQRITFDPSMRRGRGAWRDAGRIVIHQGHDILDVQTGALCPVTDFASKYIYPKAYSFAEDRVPALASKEAYNLLKICQSLPLESKMSAYLLAGWIACAQIGGVLDWRPHVWITGRKGSGKSYTMNNLILPMLGKNCLQVQSSTTEAGIRQSLQGDARPVLFDEAEGTGQRERDRLQRVLELARQASSEGGGVIAKGTAGGQALSFHIRSCFCFSSISHSITQNSDRSRVTVIEIDSKRYGGEAQYQELVKLIHDNITPDFCNAFYWRCVEIADIIRQNAKVFSDAATNIFRDRRAGDQIGALLAGAYSLSSKGLITIEDANAWVNDKNEEGLWRPLMDETEEQNDEAGLLSSIMQAHALHDGRQWLIGKLIKDVHDYTEGYGEKIKTLAAYGIKIDGHDLCIANKNDNLRGCLQHTAFGDNWAKALGRLPDARKSDAPIWFFGYKQRAVIIPVKQVISDD